MTPTEEELRTGPGAREATPPADLPIGELVGRLSDDTVHLVRDEIRLAQAEMSQKAKAARFGVAMFGGAGICGLYGFGVLIPPPPPPSSACPWWWPCGRPRSSSLQRCSP